MKQKNVLKRITAYGIVILFFIFSSYSYGIPKLLVQGPSSVHAWRQGDVAAYALNYYNNKNSLWEPQVQNRIAKQGRTVSEFPIVYYMAGKMSSFFGYQHYYTRWLHFLIFFVGLLVLVHSSAFFTNNVLLQCVPSMTLMVSPVIMYYAPNFLPDVPALCFALIGFHFFLRSYFNKYKTWDLVFMVLFSSLAMLLKMSSGILFISILGFLLYERIANDKKNLGFLPIGLISIGILSVTAWTIYAYRYNVAGGYLDNLQGILPIWDADEETKKFIFQRTWTDWRIALMSNVQWVFFLVAVLCSLVFRKKLERPLNVIVPLSLTGCVAYYLLFFRAFDHHDYYFINMFCILVLSTFVLLKLTASWDTKINWMLTALASVVIGMSVVHCTKRMEYRATEPAWNTLPHKAFLSIEPYLRSIGIEPTDKVYSPSDPSPNVTLFYMNQIGYSRYGLSAQEAIEQDVRYFVLTEEQEQSSEFEPYLDHKRGEYQGIVIYQVRD